MNRACELLYGPDTVKLSDVASGSGQMKTPTHEQIAELAEQYWAEKAAQNTPEINWRNAEETLIIELNRQGMMQILQDWVAGGQE